MTGRYTRKNIVTGRYSRGGYAMKLKRFLSFVLAIALIAGITGFSGEKAYAAPPSKPTNLRWEGTTARWDQASGASKYQIIIYRYVGHAFGATVHTEEITQNGFNVYSVMQAKGSGEYYFGVRSMSSGNEYADEVWNRTPYKYVAPGDTAVESMSASITWPIAGQTYDVNPQSGDQEKYTVELRKVNNIYCWYRSSDNKRMETGEKFQDGKGYRVELVFKAKPGYVLMPQENQVKLNGVIGDPAGTNTGNNARTYRFDFNAMGKVEAFVTRLYYICLDRAPDASGFADWVSKLKNGTKTGAQVAQGFIFSKEFKNKHYCNTCFVKYLYRAFFGREYDQGGLNNWVNKLRQGWKRQQIFNGFVGSTEFANLCSTYGITKGGKMAVPWVENVIPTLNCPICGTPPNQIYDITYVVNGGTMPEKTRYWYTKESADWVLPAPAKKGYTFGGWYKEAAHTNKVTKIPNGSTGNKTFYSAWTAIKYSVKFNANGGSGTMTNQTGIKYGTTVTLKANTFTRSGYTFNGWNRKADGSGTSYADKASVKNLASTEGGVVTLYAQWKKK